MKVEKSIAITRHNTREEIDNISNGLIEAPKGQDYVIITGSNITGAEICCLLTKRESDILSVLSLLSTEEVDGLINALSEAKQRMIDDNVISTKRSATEVQ